METPTAFILNDAIQSWRDGLSRSPNFREGDLAELEAHLRDSVAAWQNRGLTDEEAFALATRRLGHPAGLEPEFAKINRSEVWLSRLLWMLVGIQVWTVLGGLAHWATDVSVLGGLAGLGYRFPSAATGQFFWSLQSLFTAALFALANILALAACVAVCWWVTRRMETGASQVATRALRRPILVGLATIILLLLLNGAWTTESILLRHYYSSSEMGAIAISKSLAALVLWPVQTVTFVGLTILLLRRRLRLSPAS